MNLSIIVYFLWAFSISHGGLTVKCVWGWPRWCRIEYCCHHPAESLSWNFHKFFNINIFKLKCISKFKKYLRQSSGSLTPNAELGKMQLRGKIRSSEVSMLITLHAAQWLPVQKVGAVFSPVFYLSSSHLFLDTKKKVSCLTIFPVSFHFATIGVVAFSLDLLLLVFIRWLSAFYRGMHILPVLFSVHIFMLNIGPYNYRLLCFDYWYIPDFLFL